MKRIILPTDFSENSIHAIQYAMELFKEEECTFYLMNTYTPAIYQTEYVLHSPGQIGLGDVYQSESEERLEELHKSLKEKYQNPKHHIMTHSAFNILVDEVVSMTENEEAELVIMGTQGASGAKEIFLGTHTVHVIKKSKCPVIAIPADYKAQVPKTVLFPTDFEVQYRKEDLAPFLNIVSLTGASIEVLHIASGYGLTEEQQTNKSKLDELLADIPHTFHELSNQPIIEGINKFQRENSVDMLIMIQNKHTFLERLFIEPIIKKIGFHVNIPFMVIPHP